MARRIPLDRLIRQHGGSVTSGGEVVDPTNLAQVKSRHIDQLWAAADAYQGRFFSGGIFAQMYQIETMGSALAKANHQWIFRLWRAYYSRKAQVNAALTATEVLNVPLSFDAALGPPPYSVEALMGECARLLPDLLT